MKSYSEQDISSALRACGIANGDTVFFCSRLYSVGKLETGASREKFNQAYFSSIFSVIGDSGTLVVPTYSQQVGRFGLAYHHETTPTQTGIFNEYVRNLPGAVRSFHPIFSLTAIGKKAEQICGEVSNTGFGIFSAYDYLFKAGAKGVCLGFELELGHLTTGAHFVETMNGVPYYYNKIVSADAFRGGVKSDKIFIINVRYRDFGIKYNFAAYAHTLEEKGLVKSTALGDSTMYACSLDDQLRVGSEMLNKNPYAFLDSPPQWRKGEIPVDGAEEEITEEAASKLNLIGVR